MRRLMSIETMKERKKNESEREQDVTEYNRFKPIDKFIYIWFACFNSVYPIQTYI